MCQDCREQGIQRKVAQFEEPREILRGTRKRSEKTKGRKVRLDELKQAEKDWWWYHEVVEDDKARKAKCLREHSHKHPSYSCGWGDKWWTKRLQEQSRELEKIYLACQHDGII